MKFTHTLPVNAQEDSLVLDEHDLWLGLLYRAEYPLPFTPGLESFRILSRTSQVLSRELNFGQHVIHDTVSFEPMSSVTFTVPPSSNQSGGKLHIRIEPPFKNQPLSLSFEYDTPIADSDAAYEAFIKAAYTEADHDTLRVIRTLTLAHQKSAT